MTPEVISIVVLVLIFIIASVLPVNLGVLAFGAAYVVGATVGDMGADDIFLGFPSKLFVLLVGVTYLFGIAQVNGTVDWIIQSGVKLVRGRLALIPWLMFGLTALLAAMGALAAAALACIAPIAMSTAAKYKINSLMVGIMCCLGSVGGSFSPISPFGVITNGTLTDNGLPAQPILLFLNNMLFAVVIAAIVFVFFGGLKLWGQTTTVETVTAPATAEPAVVAAGRTVGGSSSGGGAAGGAGGAATGGDPGDGADTDEVEEAVSLNPRRSMTLAGIVILVVGALVFDLDVGLLAFVLSVPLVLLATDSPGEVIKKVPWSVVLLISGMLTYVGVLEAVGTLEWVGSLISGGGNPLMAALLVCFIGAIISAFAATAGVLVATIPLVVPVLLEHELSVIGVVTALTISSTIVDSSPMSTNGALLLANQKDMPERVYFRRLLVWAGLTIFAGPPLAWLAFVVTTS